MIISCPNCQTRFRVPDERIPDDGTHVRCSKCQTTFWFVPDEAPLGAGPGVDIRIPDRPAQLPSQTPPNDPAADSWFELPTLNHPAPPNTSGLALDMLGKQDQEPSQKHDMQFRDSWWGTNSLDMLMQEQGMEFELPVEDPNSGPSTLLDDHEPGEDSILGNVLEDLSTTSHFDPSYPDLASKRPQDIKLEVPSRHNSSPSPLSAPSQPVLKIEAPKAVDRAALASVRQPAEFLLMDTTQQRKDLLYTAVPGVTRAVILLALLFFFASLWTLIDKDSQASTKGLSLQTMQRTFFGSASTWRVQQVKIQQLPIAKRTLIRVTGQLLNSSEKARKAPDLLLTTSDTRIHRFPCCKHIPISKARALRTPRNIKNFFVDHYTKRPTIPPGKSRLFTVLLVPSKPIHNLQIGTKPALATPPKRSKAPKRRVKTPKKKPDEVRKTPKKKRRRSGRRKRRKKRRSNKRRRRPSKRRPS